MKHEKNRLYERKIKEFERREGKYKILFQRKKEMYRKTIIKDKINSEKVESGKLTLIGKLMPRYIGQWVLCIQSVILF